MTAPMPCRRALTIRFMVWRNRESGGAGEAVWCSSRDMTVPVNFLCRNAGITYYYNTKIIGSSGDSGRRRENQHRPSITRRRARTRLGPRVFCCAGGDLQVTSSGPTGPGFRNVSGRRQRVSQEAASPPDLDHAGVWVASRYITLRLPRSGFFAPPTRKSRI